MPLITITPKVELILTIEEFEELATALRFSDYCSDRDANIFDVLCWRINECWKKYKESEQCH